MIRDYPNLQEMDRLCFRGIELAVHDTGACAHTLHFSRPYHRAVTETILMLESSLEDIGYYFHIPVAMWGEPGARNDPILIDDTQASKTHLRRIAIVCEGKSVAAIQPSGAGLAACHAIPKGDHATLLSNSSTVVRAHASQPHDRAVKRHFWPSETNQTGGNE